MGKKYEKLAQVVRKIDDKPPYLPAALVIKPKLHNRIAQDTRKLDLSNVNLLHKLYKIHVTHGKATNFWAKPLPMGTTNFESRKKDCLIIERHNIRVSENIKSVEPTVPTIEKLAKRWEIIKQTKLSKLKYPPTLPKVKSENIITSLPPPGIAQIATERSLRFHDKRPRVCLNLYLNHHGWLGKMNAVLYSDYEPKLCHEFLNLCYFDEQCRCYGNNLAINYIIPNYFCTVEHIPDFIDDPEKQTKSFLKHGEPGILTFRRNPTNRFSFLITFRALPCMDSDYIVFGKITNKGLDTVRAIESFGTKAGHPLQKLGFKINEI